MKYPVKNVGLKHLDWVGLVLSTELPTISKALVMYLSRFMNKDQDCAWPSRTRIMDEVGIAKSTLDEHLSVLEGEGWLVRQRGNNVTTTRYFVSFPKPVEDAIKALQGPSKGSPAGGLGSPVRGLGSPAGGTKGSPAGGTRIVNRIDQIIGEPVNGTRKFQKPSIDDVRDYCREKGYQVDPEKFVNFYESKGWMVGKNKMKNWKASVATWQKNQPKQATTYYGNEV